MVGVGVRIENGVDMVDSEPEGLVAEIRGGVDQNAFFPEFKKHRGPQPFVARIIRSTDFAVAADHRDAHTCTGAQDKYGSWLRVIRHSGAFGSFAAVGGDDTRLVLFAFRRGRGSPGFVHDLDKPEAKLGQAIFE